MRVRQAASQPDVDRSVSVVDNVLRFWTAVQLIYMYRGFYFLVAALQVKEEKNVIQAIFAPCNYCELKKMRDLKVLLYF